MISARIIALSAALLVWGCASTYRGVDNKIPSAELTFVKGYTGQAFNRAAKQHYVFDNDLRCTNPRQVAVFMAITADRRTTRFQAGERIVVLARTNYLESRPGFSPEPGIDIDLYSQDCENMTSFVPEAGRSYEVLQRASVGRCDLTVIDKATGAPPPSIEAVEPVGCELYFPTHPAVR